MAHGWRWGINMNLYFSAKTCGFYLEEDKDLYTEAGSWPDDVVTLDESQEAEFWKKCPPEGKFLSSLDGLPTWEDIPKRPVTKETQEHERLRAYADPVTGCDRYFSEVLSLQAEGFTSTSPEVKEVRAKGLARKQEIQSLYPYPEE